MNVMATRLAEKDINEEIMKAFQLFDEDNTGKISFKNLKSVAKQLSENLSDEELKVRRPWRTVRCEEVYFLSMKHSNGNNRQKHLDLIL